MTEKKAIRTAEGLVFLAAFTNCVPAANWMIQKVGTTCIPNGPCLIPVAPGLTAPSGVLMVGLALVLRDLVQRRLGIWPSVGAIVIGGLLSGIFAPPALVAASVTAFLLSELADLAVFTPLQKRGLIVAALASAKIGAIAAAISTFSTPRELAWSLEHCGASTLIMLRASRRICRRFWIAAARPKSALPCPAPLPYHKW